MGEWSMKKLVCLGFVLVAFAVLVAAPAAAVPENPPPGNRCICHQTQHHQNNEGDANDNQKGVIICSNESSQQKVNQHIQKHGDLLVPTEISEAECLGEPVCAISDVPFRLECCAELQIVGTEDCQGNTSCDAVCIGG
jgi:hypothetical protein